MKGVSAPELKNGLSQNGYGGKHTHTHTHAPVSMIFGPDGTGFHEESESRPIPGPSRALAKTGGSKIQ